MGGAYHTCTPMQRRAKRFQDVLTDVTTVLGSRVWTGMTFFFGSLGGPDFWPGSRSATAWLPAPTRGSPSWVPSLGSSSGGSG